MTDHIYHAQGNALVRKSRPTVTPTGGNTGSTAWPTAATTGARSTPGTVSTATQIAGGTVTGTTFQNYTMVVGPATITDCVFLGGVGLSRASSGTTMRYCESYAGLEMSTVTNMLFENLNIHGNDDLIHIAADNPVGTRPTNIVFRNIYAHDPAPPTGAHADGIQITGGQFITLDNCYIDMGPWNANGTLNAAFFAQPSQALIGGVQVLGGYYNGGGYTFRYEGTYTDNFVVQGVTLGPDAAFGAQYAPARGTGPSSQSGNFVKAANGTLTPITFLTQ